MMDTGKQSLLLVDRSASYLLSMSMLLRKLNYAVGSSLSAEDAMKKMTQQPQSVVLTDSALPGMSGVDMLIQMRRDPRLVATPVIIHTSETDPSVQTTCVLAGCAAYLKKPAEFNVLHQAIQTAIKATPRHNIRIDTLLSVELGDTDAVKKDATANLITTLSENGLFIRTHTPKPVRTVIPLTILVNGKRIGVKAVVLYNSTRIEGRQQVPGMGMKFTEISQEDRALLREFIREQLAKEMS